MATAKVSINDTVILDLTGTTTEAADAKAGTKFLNDAGVETTGTATARSSSDLTASGATVTVPAGIYSAQASKAVATGTAGTPTATKGTVSNHAVSVTPSVTNSEGYIAGGTKTGTAVSVTASELVSGSETKTANGTYDVTNLASLVVNVSSSGMNKQAYFGSATSTATAYTATTVSLTVAVTGTYKVSWTGWRNTTSGTSGSQLYRTRSGSTTAIGNANTTFQNSYGHRVELTGQQFNKDDVITVYARARSAQYVMGVANLVIEQTA